MRNLLLRIAYNGARYHGYQVQQNAVTVAGTFQPVLEMVLNEKVQLKGCSRTDTGVHASDFAVSFRTNSAISCRGLVQGLNINLPPDIAAKSCEEREEDFHARYSCTGKRYVYRVRDSEIRSPFEQDQVLLFKYPLDPARLNAAAQGFVGRYDYRAFCSAGGSVEDTVRTIYDFCVERRGDLVEFSVTGDGFLYNMVRIMVGTLLDMGRGKIECSPEVIRTIIAGKKRSRAGYTAPAHGLYLDRVFYEPIETKPT
ncbi:MAG: tRNA pseudouridine(38-40) synthase TruA [Clostridiales bacterium]|nr:tRNA pseudouridine(38-40) synthase TruA [Clostridiales bacterium]